VTDTARGVVLALAAYIESDGAFTRRERQRIVATLRELLARAEAAEAERDLLKAERNLYAALAKARMQRADAAHVLAEAVRAEHAALAKMETAENDGVHWEFRDAFREALTSEAAGLAAWDALDQNGDEG
jgi:predicted molibdopterin-dependent oxidoreductase YjgC